MDHIFFDNLYVPISTTKIKPTISLTPGRIYYHQKVGIFLLLEGLLMSKIQDKKRSTLFYELGDFKISSKLSFCKKTDNRYSLHDTIELVVGNSGLIEIKDSNLKKYESIVRMN